MTGNSVHEHSEQESPAPHDDENQPRNASPRASIFETQLDDVEVPARSGRVLNVDANDEPAEPISSVMHANETSSTSTQLADRDDSAVSPLWDDHSLDEAVSSGYAAVRNDDMQSGASGAQGGGQLEDYPRSLESLMYSDAGATGRSRDGATAEYASTAQVHLPTIILDNDARSEASSEISSRGSADVGSEGAALRDAIVGIDAGTTAGPGAQADAAQEAEEVGEVRGDEDSSSESTAPEIHSRDGDVPLGSSGVREVVRRDEVAQPPTLGAANDPAVDMTRRGAEPCRAQAGSNAAQSHTITMDSETDGRQRRDAGQTAAFPESTKRQGPDMGSQGGDPRGVGPDNNACSKNAAPSAVTNAGTEANESSTVEAPIPAPHNASVGGGGHGTKAIDPAANLPTVAPAGAMDRVQSNQSVAREDMGTDSKGTASGAPVPNIKSPSTASKANELQGGEETGEAVKNPKKAVSFLQKVGRFLKAVVCCR